MELFDAHCHLQDSRIRKRLPELIGYWRNIGGGHLVCCAAGQDDWSAVADLALQYPEIIPCFGLHPWYLETATADWESRLINHLQTVPSGIGEIGLDFAVKNADREHQLKRFRRQLQIAKELQLPVSVHVRKAWDAFSSEIKTLGRLPAGGLIHSWSGSAEMVRQVEKLGFMTSFSGSIAYEGNRRGIASLKAVSETSILLETDSPDILPRLPETQGQSVNVPGNLMHINRIAAAARGMTPERLASVTCENGIRLFRDIITRRCPAASDSPLAGND